jgi:transposase-like protein
VRGLPQAAISAHQLHRSLGLSYKAAWFMAHRLRHAMSAGIFAGKLTGTVEVDETYVGGRTVGTGHGFKGNKTPVVTIVERGGDKRSMVMERVTAHNLQSAVRENVLICSNVYTDEHAGYVGLSPKFEHKSVKHCAKEYARKEKGENVHTNTVESSFSLLKRGIVGAFHHVSKKHLGLYISEFDFRWNHRKTTDGERTVAGLARCKGKRLSYAPLTAKA